jgi:hypothetical protein
LILAETPHAWLAYFWSTGQLRDIAENASCRRLGFRTSLGVVAEALDVSAALTELLRELT